MRGRHRIVWIVAALWVAVGACSKKDPANKPLKMAAGGPAAPEIGMRESSERVERAPISLTASDGTGLRLVSLHARTVIEDPLAFTELHLTFHNPEPRRREGRFEITLPPQAAISRFAMRVGDELQEGEVVERRRAQQVYEDFLHRKQDPALLEKDAGNEFAARVFPIEANASKEIILSYSEELTRHDQPYLLRLHGLPKLDELKVEVHAGSSSATGQESSDRARGRSGRLTLDERDYVPVGDIEVRVPWQKSVALRSGELVVARVAPVLELPAAPITGLTVLVDTSASRALGFGAQIERLGALLAELSRRADFDLRVVAFDQSAEETYRGPASAFGVRQQSTLLAREALGATDLAQALAFVAREPARHERVLVICDGVLTAGADDTTGLREAVARLAAHGVRRLDVLAEGGIQDRESLLALTRAGLASTGVVLDASTGARQLADKLRLGTSDRVMVQITGATFVHPSVLEGVQPGDEFLVFAELPADVPVQIELVGAGAEAFETLAAPRPLLERAWARAKIEALSAELRALRPDATSERSRKEGEIVALSVAQRVVSDWTALLVLENERDYRQFGIAQNALTSILRVGEEGIELFDRTGVELPRPRRPLQVAVEGFADDEVAREPEPPTDSARAEPAATTGGAREQPSLGTIGSGSESSTGRGAGVRMRRAPSEPAASPAKGESPMIAPRRELAPESAAPSAQASAPPAAMPGGAPSAKRSSAPGALPIAPPSSEAESKSKTANASPSARADLALDELAGAAADGMTRRPVPEERLAIAVPPALEAHAEVRLRSAHGVPSELAAQVLRSSLRARARQCYAAARTQAAGERVALEISLSDKGSVSDARVGSSNLGDARAQACIVTAARALRFPKPDAAGASVHASVELSMRPSAVLPRADEPRRPQRARAAVQIPRPALEDAHTGVLGDVLAAVARGDRAGALARATAARSEDPGDVIALIALGEALEAQQDLARAARAYGSLIDLFPSRADLRRMASARLERLANAGLALAVDSYRRAAQQRPDHPSGHRSLAYALWKNGEHAAAFETLERALDHGYAGDRFEGVDRILREDISLLAAAWIRADASAEPRVRQALAARGLQPDRAPSLRFVLSWETDANDVDFHVYDGRGGHAFYMKPKLPSGGALYADITTGYGPECFAIPGRSRSYPYVLQAHYFARGPMGYGMGKLQVVQHDGQGGLTFAEHPFVIMKDKAFVELARIEAPLGS